MTNDTHRYRNPETAALTGGQWVRYPGGVWRYELSTGLVNTGLVPGTCGAHSGPRDTTSRPRWCGNTKTGASPTERNTTDS